MARYTIRIELRDATWDNYKDLYDLLAAQGITDEIVSDDGVRYRLPPAEYAYDGLATRSEVLEMAKRSSAKVVRRFAVLVTESAGRTWYGLEKV